MDATLELFTNLFNIWSNGDDAITITLLHHLRSFSRKRRSLLRINDVKKSETIPIKTKKAPIFHLKMSYMH